MGRTSILLNILIAVTVIVTLSSHYHLAAILVPDRDLWVSLDGAQAPGWPRKDLPEHHSLVPLLNSSSLPSSLQAQLSSLLLSPLLNFTYRLPPHDPLDFLDLGRRQLAYGLFFRAVEHLGDPISPIDKQLRTNLSRLMHSFERSLYPWAAPLGMDLLAFKQTFSRRGIAITTGPQHLRYTLLNLRHLKALGCQLPIEVWLTSRGDLEESQIREMQSLNASVRVIDELIDNTLLRLSGFANKPFALLLSSFRETLLLDADAYFLRNPASLFTDPYYEANRALFFPDATLVPQWSGEKKEFLSRLFEPGAAPYRVTNTRFFRGESIFEQESSVVLVDKGKRFLGVLAAAQLNAHDERMYIYRHVWGDKETFWLGFGMAAEPFDFSPHSPGVIGELSPDGQLCGQMAHPDHRGHLLFWNGGVAPTKQGADTHKAIQFSAWGVPEGWMGPGLCIRPKKAQLLSTDEGQAVARLLGMWEKQQAHRNDQQARVSRIVLGLIAALVLICLCLTCYCWCRTTPLPRDLSGEMDDEAEEADLSDEESARSYII